MLWEELGETTLAIEAARTAGDLERAYQLLRQAKEPVPEGLAVSVKAVRLLQQLYQKHQGLYPAERTALRAALRELDKSLHEEGGAPDEEW